MSKVVKAVVGGVTSVVKGVVNVVKGAVKGVGDLVKSIASSKLGKAIIIAGAIYFGGAALAGGFGSSAAGGSFLSGMGTGISSAASSLSSAWGSAMAGEFGTAASTVGNAWGTAGTAAGQAATGAMTVAPTAAATTVSAPTVGAPTAAANGGITQANVGSTMGGAKGLAMPASAPLASAGVAPVAPAAAATGFSSLSPLAQYGAITAGTQVVGGLIQGAGQKAAAEDQRDYELRMAQEARDRYNSNVGTSLWASNQPVDPNTGLPGANAWDPQAAARDINARYSAPPSVATVGSPGLINRNLSTVPAGTPMANNNYPVYNPYYANPGRGG
jgi:hypothetical protein